MPSLLFPGSLPAGAPQGGSLLFPSGGDPWGGFPSFWPFGGRTPLPEGSSPGLGDAPFESDPPPAPGLRPEGGGSMWGQYDLDTPFAGQGGDWSRGSDALQGMSAYGGKEYDTWLDPYLDQLGLGLLGAGMGGIPGQVSGVATDLAGRREGGQSWGQALAGAAAGAAGGYLGIPGMGSASDWAFGRLGPDGGPDDGDRYAGFAESLEGVQFGPESGAIAGQGGLGWGGASPPPGFEAEGGVINGVQENPWFGADTPSGGPGAEIDSNPWRSTGHWAPERGVDASRFLRPGGFDPYSGFAGSAGDVLSGYNYDSFYGIDHFRV